MVPNSKSVIMLNLVSEISRDYETWNKSRNILPIKKRNQGQISFESFGLWKWYLGMSQEINFVVLKLFSKDNIREILIINSW